MKCEPQITIADNYAVNESGLKLTRKINIHTHVEGRTNC